MALLMDPLAVKAQAFLPRCSSGCGSSNKLTDLSPFPKAVAEVSFPRFCQSLVGPQQATSDNDTGRARPGTDDY